MSRRFPHFRIFEETGHVARVGLAVLVALAVLAQAPGSAEAQEAPPHDDVLSANPFLVLFEWFNVEWEHRVRPTSTVGLGGTSVSFDDDGEYLNLSGFFRYYPQERAPDGFFVGPRLGLYRLSDSQNASQTVGGFGFEIGYTWLLGSNESFALSLGGGATRVFGVDEVNVESVVPVVRLVNLGWAF
ncbi:MAG: hypothetical protein ACOC8K_00995 [Gemmatimonadota bacterium]